MQKVWTKLLVVAAIVLMGATAQAVTYQYTGPDDGDFPGVTYEVTVKEAATKVYDVFVQLNTSGVMGSTWLDAFALKVSAGNTASVSNVVLPAAGWSTSWFDAWFTVFSSGSAGQKDATDIATGGTFSLSYTLTLSGQSEPLVPSSGPWSIKATYLTPKPNHPGNYNQTGVSFELMPDLVDGVIPEPATLLLFGMGLAAPLGLLRRKG